MDEIDVWTGPKDNHFILLRRTTLGWDNFPLRPRATKYEQTTWDTN
jgi:hypothetical protein